MAQDPRSFVSLWVRAHMWAQENTHIPVADFILSLKEDTVI